MAVRIYTSQASRNTKRAIDKEYRLLKGGMSREMVNILSPRVSAKEYNAMTSTQKARYTKRLNNFAKRDTYVTLESGERASGYQLRRVNELIGEFNERADETRERIDKLSGEKLGTSIAKARAATAKYDPASGEFKPKRGQVLGAVSRISVTEKPRTVAQLQSRLKQIGKAVETSYDERRKRLRDNIDDMLAIMGADDYLRERMRSMSDDDFDVLITSTDFMDKLALEFELGGGTPDRKSGKHFSPNWKDLISQSEHRQQGLDFVSMILSNYNL